MRAKITPQPPPLEPFFTGADAASTGGSAPQRCVKPGTFRVSAPHARERIVGVMPARSARLGSRRASTERPLRVEAGPLLHLVAFGGLGHHSPTPRRSGNRISGRARRLPQVEHRARKRIGSNRLSGPKRATRSRTSVGVARPQFAHSNHTPIRCSTMSRSVNVSGERRSGVLGFGISTSLGPARPAG